MRLQVVFLPSRRRRSILGFLQAQDGRECIVDPRIKVVYALYTTYAMFKTYCTEVILSVVTLSAIVQTGYPLAPTLKSDRTRRQTP